MVEIIGVAVFICVAGVVATILLVQTDRKTRLFEDDGFVWNVAIEKRREQERRKKDGKAVG